MSVELRSEVGQLICEFCMINFDYGLQVFSNDVTNIYMTVNSLLLFHEENPITDEKSVMFGPLNC